MSQEHLLQKEIKEYLEKNGWKVKEHIKRKDTINWEHSYEADLLIRHPNYPLLGWMGIELKDTPNTKTAAVALKQVLSKYQNHFFEDIDQPIHIWIIIVNQNEIPDSSNIGNPYTQNKDWQQSYSLGYRRVCQQFGVGYFDWKAREKNPIYEQKTGCYGDYEICKFNLIDLRSEAPNGNICLEQEGMKHYVTDEVAITNFLADRTDFAKHFNLNNMKFLQKIKKGVNINGRSLFEFA